MNSIQNKVQLIGRLGRDPEILNLEEGKKAAKFSIATNEYYINSSGQKVEITNWHHVIFWNKYVDVIEKYVFKGGEIAVEGKLTSRSWEDNTGTKHYRTEVLGEELLLLGKRAEVPIE